MVHGQLAIQHDASGVGSPSQWLSHVDVKKSRSLTAVICTPAAPKILMDFGSHNNLYATIVVSVMELGMIVGPLFIAPLSEMYGRTTIYNIGNVLFVATTVGAALSSNFNMLIAFRFLSGMTLASPTLNPAIVGDMFIQEERGTAMSIMAAAPLLGPIAGPIIGGYLTQTRGWRWVFWLPAITGGFCGLIILLFLQESYKVKIISQKAIRLRNKTGKPFKSVYDRKFTDTQTFRLAVTRPIALLIRSPVICLLATYLAVVYGYLYLLLTTLAEVFEGIYHFDTGPVGFTFLGLGTTPFLSLSYRHVWRVSANMKQGLEWLSVWCSAEPR